MGLIEWGLIVLFGLVCVAVLFVIGMFLTRRDDGSNPNTRRRGRIKRPPGRTD